MPPLDCVTPVILTYNEQANIGRTLECLTWANRVVVVDSGSADGTVNVIASFPNVDLFEREFDSHARQWNYGLAQVDTDWTLALDADYRVPGSVVEEISDLPELTSNNGFFADFDYVALDRRLERTLYPSRQVLFRTSAAVFEDDGHTQRVRVKGSSGHLDGRLIHDDRKPLDRWVRNQVYYARREARKLTSKRWSELSLFDRVRRTRVLGPPSIFVYCLLVKRLILEGWPGVYYTMERTGAEIILSLSLLRSEQDEQDG